MYQVVHAGHSAVQGPVTATAHARAVSQVGMSALSVLAARLRRRAVPNRWSFMFGVAPLACLTVLVVTGIFLLFFYNPSTATIKYDGSYAPLQGVEVSRAFNSSATCGQAGLTQHSPS
jgi:ubiquinol-cytochrome c reductase cytochrome b subunit